LNNTDPTGLGVYRRGDRTASRQPGGDFSKDCAYSMPSASKGPFWPVSAEEVEKHQPQALAGPER
jgi:hypothetical protein